MATPFAADGSVDLEEVRRLAVFLVEHGSHGLVVGGTTGEGPTLSDEEEILILKAVREELGDDALLICGTGTNDTRHSCELTRMAADAGADGSLVVAPYYNKPNEAGLWAHYEAVANAVPEQPMIVYNIPSRVIVNVPADMLAQLAEIDNIVAVKQANDAELEPIEGMTVLAGNDSGLMKVLEFGGGGGILVASHLVGDGMRKMWDLAQEGKLREAREVDAGLTQVYDAVGVTTNPMPLKAGLQMLGLCDDRVRLPLVTLSPEHRAVMESALRDAGVLTAS